MVQLCIGLGCHPSIGFSHCKCSTGVFLIETQAQMASRMWMPKQACGGVACAAWRQARQAMVSEMVIRQRVTLVEMSSVSTFGGLHQWRHCVSSACWLIWAMARWIGRGPCVCMYTCMQDGSEASVERRIFAHVAGARGTSKTMEIAVATKLLGRSRSPPNTTTYDRPSSLQIALRAQCQTLPARCAPHVSEIIKIDRRRGPSGLSSCDKAARIL